MKFYSISKLSYEVVDETSDMFTEELGQSNPFDFALEFSEH